MSLPHVEGVRPLLARQTERVLEPATPRFDRDQRDAQRVGWRLHLHDRPGLERIARVEEHRDARGTRSHHLQQLQPLADRFRCRIERELAESNFILAELAVQAKHELHVWAGRATHRLRRVDGALRMSGKTVVLINAAEPLPNLSFLI